MSGHAASYIHPGLAQTTLAQKSLRVRSRRRIHVKQDFAKNAHIQNSLNLENVVRILLPEVNSGQMVFERSNTVALFVAEVTGGLFD